MSLLKRSLEFLFVTRSQCSKQIYCPRYTCQRCLVAVRRFIRKQGGWPVAVESGGPPAHQAALRRMHAGTRHCSRKKLG